jgi:hypothetical protein
MSSVGPMMPSGPVRSAAIWCAVSSILGSSPPPGPGEEKFALTKLRSPVFIR